MKMGASESTPEPKKETKKLSPYMKFCKETRTTVVKENPKLTFGEVGRKMGEIWRDMSEDDKKKYSK